MSVRHWLILSLTKNIGPILAGRLIDAQEFRRLRFPLKRFAASLLEELRSECNALWGASSKAYFSVDKLLRELANPNLHDIGNLPFHVELWDRHSERLRWTVAACGNVALANGAFDQALKHWPGQRLALRQGAMLIREHPRGGDRIK